MSEENNKYIEVSLNFLHRYYPKLEEKGYNSRIIALQLHIPENWYNWRKFWLNYQKNPHVLINNKSLKWLESNLGKVEYRINEGMKVYSEFIDGFITRDDAIHKLISFIENDSKPYNRIGAVYALKLLRLRDQKIFNICENLAISDEDPDVRYKAVNVLIENFADKSSIILEWVINYDPSEETFHKILKDLDKRVAINSELQAIIEKRLTLEQERDALVKKIDDEFYGSFRVLILD